MTRAGKIKIFTKAYCKYRDLYDIKDLKREKLTLTEYHLVGDILKSLSGINDMETTTFVEAAANWFKRNGFSVEQGTGVDCISWIIKIA